MSAGAEPKSDKLTLKEAVVVCGLCLIGFLVVRTFAFQQFHIPSGSMKPTLLIGDVLAVAKYPYGYSRYSLPFAPPLFVGRIFAGEPSRGDVVVFRLPNGDSDLIKRIVGLPGDRVQMIGGVLHLNGEPVKRERLEDVVDTEEVAGHVVRIKRWRETLPNGVSYTTLDLFDDGDFDNTEVYVVPSGHYFMMGDNRDGSTDSRALDEVGYVPFDNIVGRAKIIYFSIGDGAAAWEVWRWPEALRFSRFFMTIR